MDDMESRKFTIICVEVSIKCVQRLIKEEGIRTKKTLKHATMRKSCGEIEAIVWERQDKTKDVFFNDFMGFFLVKTPRTIHASSL
ncbi:hypothetical protein AWH48_03630 [Domibacillus aminovorans]|uniref:Transposase n=1 Tax=Domibacillus aminovorans TaxID=29332 RepID=A0A177KRT4_9BACI|nr:hypothetical protein AWH48_03630 [Domibacillus aminovorans]